MTKNDVTVNNTIDITTDEQMALVSRENLTPDVIQRYSDITKSLVVSDINSLNNYGSELSTIMSQNSNELLKAVRTNNGGEVSKLTSDLLNQLEMIDIDELGNESKWKAIMRKIPVIKNFIPSIAQILNKYDHISETVESISKKINAVSLISKRDNTSLETIFQNDVKYIEQIRELISAAEMKYTDLQKELADMQSHSEDYEAYELSDMGNFISGLEKKINDMKQVEYVMKMNLLQIRACQQNNNLVASKADTFVSTVVPVWKNQLSISVIMDNQKKNTEAIRQMSDTSNKIIEKNAELLKTNSIATAKEAERSIFDAQSLQKATDLMIQTVNEVNSIYDKAYEDRKQFAKQLINMENQLNVAAQCIGQAATKVDYLEQQQTLKELGRKSA